MEAIAKSTSGAVMTPIPTAEVPAAEALATTLAAATFPCTNTSPVCLQLQVLGYLRACIVHHGNDVLEDIRVRVAGVGGPNKKTGGPTTVADSACTPDTMHVVLDVPWQVIIDDMRDFRDVQATSGDISCNQESTLT
eukprot:CAMPEP_0195038558 /NCGR_PEP_ID=MMETSP0326_2-20130528/77692_1 /TAXON_ID=2866 ORGANISM="Crypthecodinium cohnii, Strain Seligo" /NCGR_SAMPLE_ID=MMETSP0326_2 /ASSEMBLY_ACC=CAM_ASM_000348 /LENGTH=136 /DNA_ID=CAMNT_0040065053 /DNA_START=184 /DNA_END=594 /DNA_ORIENTATION=+